MGPSLLYHLGGCQGGIEHFFEQFTAPHRDEVLLGLLSLHRDEA
jgi:hypothetical protein